MNTRRQHAEITTDEVIALLSRSSLPTVIVEGNDDMIFFRRVQESLSDLGISPLAVGGREKVLEVFLRRNEIPETVRVFFVADRDTWVNTDIPEEYCSPKITFTDGYSLENDAIRDGNLEDFLTDSERRTYFDELEQFIDWYALILHRKLSGRGGMISLNPNQVLCPHQHPILMQLDACEVYPAPLRQDLRRDYLRKVRGKSLLGLLIRQLSATKRAVKHNSKTLIEMAAVRPGTHLQAIVSSIDTAFRKQ